MPAEQDEGSFTLTITGRGPWEKRATDAEAMRMAIYVTMAEARGAEGRCATCAFRTGTDANGSSLVVRCVEHALQQEGNAFMCHSVPEGERRVCAGFSAIADAFTKIAESSNV